MNDQERQVISDIFRRLEQVANQPRDPEAERFIAEKLRQQPYAPYAMAQAIFVQEQALANLQAENEHLRSELEQASRRPQGGGFLASIFGGGSRPPGPAYNTPPTRPASPWSQPQHHPHQHHYGAPQGGMMGGAPGPWGGGMMQRGGGGFLSTALSTAAGVAGGMMIANALTHAFSGENNPLSDASSLAGLGGADQAADAGGLGNITDSLYQAPQDSQQDFSDFGGDGGDEGDWA
ncbi:DUF2076 domain-containing protein [Microvirga arsenatis]|uniref:DUF2076 family protein n=1 Tax=Microvirga arsenatis TaxID=2692265 RepID=A0ABW9Z136_9HYPH|nr:DUF2076 domain-containing protein [Microvirga arsenatis]NBJ12527.1 DUF2076 family protein [Microvirga arsenatis]NBJ26235.1 DUF2076 family protein [Microvirga arsenatis]